MRPTITPPSFRFPLTVRAVGRALRRAVRGLGLVMRGERPGSFFDIRNLSLVNRWLASAGAPPLVADPRHADADSLGAARFVLALLASSSRLRTEFPRALSDGPDGAFARWLDTRGWDIFGLSYRSLVNIRAAFAFGHSGQGERVYETRADVREMFPLGLTPAQRGAFLEWFTVFGHREEVDTDPVSIVWALTELDEAPDRGLLAAFLTQPGWQERFPYGGARFGWDELKRWVGARYHIRGRWLRKASFVPQYGPWDELAFLLQARPDLAATFPHDPAESGDPAPVIAWVQSHKLPAVDAAWEMGLAAEIRDGLPRQVGVNAVGLFRYPSGLQQAATDLVSGLVANAVRTELRDVPIRTARDRRPRTGFDGLERFPVTILNTGLDIGCREAYRIAGLHPREGVYRVAVWWWELNRLPVEWLDRGKEVGEIWAPTAFIAGAMESLGKPVYRMPPGVELPAFEPIPKAAFGLDSDRFTFLFVFDMNSRMARKNPLGLIRAFRQAFRPTDPVDLVIKVSPQESHYTTNWRDLRSAAASAGVRLIDRSLSRSELLGLMDTTDAYISLHRSEGFGLTLAEAMLLGKPTVATGYSGNVDFMTPQNSYLVDWSPVVVDAPEVTAPPGAIWAEPSIDHAAALMREIVGKPEAARARGERARADLRAQLSHRAAGERMVARLREITGGANR